MKATRAVGLGFVSIILAAGAVRAADVGPTIVPKDHRNKEHWEVVYEDVSRELDSNNGPRGIGDKLDAHALYARFHTDIGQSATLDFDAGIFDADSADTAFYGGVGLRFLAYDGDRWRLGTVLQVHYAPGVSGDRTTGGARGDTTEFDYDLLEVDGALPFAAKVKLDQDLTLMPYVGPAFSVLDFNGDVKTAGEKHNISAGENNVVGGVAGIALVLPEHNTLRIEARVFDSVTWSAAAGIAF